MRSTTLLITVVGVAVALVGSACSKGDGSSNETASNQAEPIQVAQQDTPREEAVQDQSMTASGRAYAQMLEEVRAVEKSATSQEAVAQAVPKIEQLFKSFRADYVGTREAADAAFQLGILYTTLQRPTEAIVYLREFVETAQNVEPGQVAYANFYLAEAYKQADQFDDARRHYNVVLNEHPSIDPRLRQAAQSSMEDLDTLKKLSVGSDPIPFDVRDTDGNPLSLAGLKGQVVLLDFWATWCGPCRAEMPNVVNVYKKYHEKGFEVVGISLDRDRAAMDRYTEANSMPWPQYYDGKYWNNEISMMYKIRSIPQTFLIDRNGKIRYRSLRGPALETAVAKLLAES